MSRINTVKTLDDLINFTDQFDPKALSYYSAAGEGDDRLIVLSTNLFSMYQKYIRKFVETYSVTEEQRRQFRCRPQLLSTAFYGTPNLYWLVLMLNNRECPSKFKLKKYVHMIPIESLNIIYDTIIAKGRTKLESNWAEMLTDL